jgi:hypothetical protein
LIVVFGAHASLLHRAESSLTIDLGAKEAFS